MKISSNIDDIRKMLDRNSPVILTGLAISGTLASVFLTYKGTQKSTLEIATKANHQNQFGGEKISNQEKILMTYKNYVPAAITTVGTCTCMVVATKIGLNRTAALGAAFVIAERNGDAYKEKVKEILGENKHVKVNDAVASEHLAQAPALNPNIILTDGEQWFLDDWSGRIFRTNIETYKQAVNEFNYDLLNDDSRSLSDFYSKIGLDTIQESDSIGWSSDRLLTVNYTTDLKDGKACVVTTFDRNPVPQFWKS